MLTNVCLFITGPDRRHNRSIHATQIILLFHKVFIMNHSQIHIMRKKKILFTYMFFASINTPLCKKKKAKCVPLKTCSAILPVDLNLLIYLVVRCRHPAGGKEDRVHHRSHRGLTSSSSLGNILQHCSFPRLPHYQSSPSKTSLGGDEGRNGGGGGERSIWGNLVPL